MGVPASQISSTFSCESSGLVYHQRSPLPSPITGINTISRIVIFEHSAYCEEPGWTGWRIYLTDTHKGRPVPEKALSAVGNFGMRSEWLSKIKVWVRGNHPFFSAVKYPRCRFSFQTVDGTEVRMSQQ